MPLPRWVARFNKRVTNRFLEPLARRHAGFAVVEHRGRRSGANYRTPVNVFDAGDEIVVALTYGPGADWVQNVLDRGGAILRQGDRSPIATAQIVERAEAWPYLPGIVRIALRLLTVNHFCRIRLGHNTSP